MTEDLGKKVLEMLKRDTRWKGFVPICSPRLSGLIWGLSSKGSDPKYDPALRIYLRCRSLAQEVKRYSLKDDARTITFLTNGIPHTFDIQLSSFPANYSRTIKALPVVLKSYFRSLAREYHLEVNVV